MTPFIKHCIDHLEAFENEEISFDEAVELIREYAEEHYVGG